MVNRLETKLASNFRSLLIALLISSLCKAQEGRSNGKMKPPSYREYETRRSLIDTPLDLDNLPGPPFPDYADGDCAGLDNVMTVNFGWYQSWATYRDADCNRFPPSALDALAYTHLAYSFAWINEDYELEPYDGNFEEEERLYQEFVNLKLDNPQLKTLIAVGGWTFSDPGPTATRFSDTVSTPERRSIFVNSAIDFCRKYGFDGLDLDWEFPGASWRGGKEGDKENYAQLVLDLRQAFDASDLHLEVTMSVPLAVSLLDLGFDLPTLAQGLDFMNLLAYDLHGIWEDVADSHTNLEDIFGFLEYFVVDQGFPRNKMVLGLASYGRSYLMNDPNCQGFGCPIDAAGHGGCMGIDTLMPYFSIVEYLADGNYNAINIYDPVTGSSELVVEDNILITYDSPQALSVRALYAQESCFRGLMWWAADMLSDPVDLQVDLNPAPPTPLNPLPGASSPSPTPQISMPTAGPSQGPTEETTEPLPPTNSPSALPTMDGATKEPSLSPSVTPTVAPNDNPPTRLPLTRPPTFAPTPSSGAAAVSCTSWTALLLVVTLGAMGLK